jgi:hypothetical protein
MNHATVRVDFAPGRAGRLITPDTVAIAALPPHPETWVSG